MENGLKYIMKLVMLLKCYSVFDSKIKSAIDTSTTCRLISAKNKRLKEWMTNELLISAHRKKYLSIKCKKHPNNQCLALHYKNTKITL